MEYKEELAALKEYAEKKKKKEGKQRRLISVSGKTLFFFFILILAASGVFVYFFNGKSEEDLIREQFHNVAALLKKEGKEGVIVAAANMQKLGGYFCPVTHVSIEGVSFLNGNLDREAIIRHAFRSRSMFDRLSLHFSLYEFGIHNENATVLFTVTLTGTLKNGDRITEARELEAVLSKESGKWLFRSCRINELIKK